MKTIKGDLIKLALKNEFDVIIHGCNCMCKMGSGIALTIKNTFPNACEIDLATEKGSKEKLGTISSVKIDVNGEALVVVNAYTQYDWRRNKGQINADYDAIRSAFKEIKHQFSGKRIGYPAIGAGLARGDWSIISNIIKEELEGEDHTFVEYQP